MFQTRVGTSGSEKILLNLKDERDVSDSSLDIGE